MPDEIDLLIEKLILIGAMEVSGINEDGEFLYGFTPKLKEINPELFNLIHESINNGIMSLWADGFLDINVESEDPMVRLTEKCFDEEAINALEPKRREFLEGIISRFEE